MQFEDSYRRVVSESEYYSDRDPHRTILPFFGFKLGRDSESKISTYGGNTYVTQVSNDTFKVSKSATGLYYRTKHFETFTREKPIFTDYALESKVQAWLKKNGIKDIWASPYIAPTLEDYHYVNGWGPRNGLFAGIILAVLVIGVLLSVAMAVVSNQILALLPEFFQDLKMQLIVMPFGGSVTAAILLLIAKVKHNNKQRKLPLQNRDQKYKDELRARYYKCMVLLFGEEIGQGMKELSIAREKDRKK